MLTPPRWSTTPRRRRRCSTTRRGRRSGTSRGRRSGGRAFAGALEQQRGGERGHKRVGHTQVRGHHAAQGAAGAGDLGHHRVAAGQAVRALAVGDQIGFARDRHGAQALGVLGTQVQGQTFGGTGGGVHVVGGFHAGRPMRAVVGGAGVLWIPHRFEREDLGGVRAHDRRRHVTHAVEDPCARGAESGGHRVEHPTVALLVQRLGDLAERVLVERQQRAHVDVGGPADRRDIDHVVGQEAHRGGAACGELRVGHKVDGDEVRERLCHRRVCAHRFDGGTDGFSERARGRHSGGGW